MLPLQPRMHSCFARNPPNLKVSALAPPQHLGALMSSSARAFPFSFFSFMRTNKKQMNSVMIAI